MNYIMKQAAGNACFFLHARLVTAIVCETHKLHIVEAAFARRTSFVVRSSEVMLGFVSWLASGYALNVHISLFYFVNEHDYIGPITPFVTEEKANFLDLYAGGLCLTRLIC